MCIAKLQMRYSRHIPRGFGFVTVGEKILSGRKKHKSPSLLMLFFFLSTSSLERVCNFKTRKYWLTDILEAFPVFLFFYYYWFDFLLLLVDCRFGCLDVVLGLADMSQSNREIVSSIIFLLCRHLLWLKLLSEIKKLARVERAWTPAENTFWAWWTTSIIYLFKIIKTCWAEFCFRLQNDQSTSFSSSEI